MLQLGRLTCSVYVAVSFLNFSLVPGNVGHQADGCKKCSPMNEEDCYQGGSCKSAGTQQKCLEAGGEYCVTDFSCEDCVAKGETCFRKNWAEPCYSPTKASCTADPLAEWCGKSFDNAIETGQADTEGSEGAILLWSLVAAGTLALVSVGFSTHFYFSKTSMWTPDAPIDRRTERQLDQLDRTLQDSEQSCCGKSIAQAQKDKDGLLAQAALKAAGGPEFWSLAVWHVGKFLKDHVGALEKYCENHTLHITSDPVPECWHICHEPNCPMDHGDVPHAHFSTEGDPLEANMHVVVSYLIKPMTNERVQPLVSSGKVARGTLGMWAYLTEGRIRRAKTFVSHCWNEKFKDFVDTLYWLDPEDDVWICSFALPQNINIGEVLGKKPSNSPFAQALRQSQQVLLAVDEKIEPPKRSWCCFELYLAHQQNKTIFIEQPMQGRNSSQILSLKEHVYEELKNVKLEECSASRQEDKKKIMKEIGSHVAEVESIVADAAKVSYQRAKRLLTASTASDSLPGDGGKMVTETSCARSCGEQLV